ncbi:hypothetical protein [Rubrivirga marina]|uniref:DUF2846 domain-containing protein n=1 Tax=Rubrivirga marina TaxID=1196024 RepID=A0A271J4I3_9BACT|nr:hypothetical protein [Rubrivirga marina]PAP78260.1 hypothetical protein BSZ37_18430 [Rubrivirga marina]
MRALALAALLAAGPGCAGPGAPATPETDARPPVETDDDLVRAFLVRGWTVLPVGFSTPFGVAGEGTVYRVQNRTVVVYDYASPEEAEAHAHEDADRLLRLGAGQEVTVYRRPSLVVVTFGRARGAFEIRLARLLAGPSLARVDYATAAPPTAH